MAEKAVAIYRVRRFIVREDDWIQMQASIDSWLNTAFCRIKDFMIEVFRANQAVEGELHGIGC